MATHYDQFKQAWDTNAPLALDRVAERLAAAGVAETDMMTGLERLLMEVRAAGADDETEERVLGVMDRLTGWCHESNHIKTTRAVPGDSESADGRGAEVGLADHAPR